MAGWTFSALGFTVLWRAAGHDVLPYPLQFRSTAETSDELEAQWKAEAADLAGRIDDSAEAAVRILHGPESRIEIAGFAAASNGSGDLEQMGDPRHRVRIHAAVHYRQAVLVTQQPSSDPESGGTVRMSLLRAESLTRHLLAAIPGHPRGTRPALQVNRADLTDDDRPYTAFHDDAPRSPRDEAARFFERPRSTVLHVAVCPGPAWDRRPTPARDFHIMDYSDGRYLVRHTKHDLRADPADTSIVQNHLQRLIDATVQGFREDNDPSYA
ncbi:hypothetical protein J2W56_003154 [Nocardia kruczakiae]|uniref:ESAT-6 protein secretion system EspG family protein n=1 Tax=Nocardia kruczakiae TaxID=261477 RepID=A0ABU1XFT5_9NOCA|nr:ESX secretion-associated protein EspG [Nocardia kruczakiae]MDR7169413.1 hypothetical protein [Nocardia kruczakiae]